MTQEEATTEPITAAGTLRQVVTEIAETDIDDELVRLGELGTANFSDSRPLFEQVLGYAARLSKLPWEKLPESQVSTLVNAAESLSNSLQSVSELSLDAENPVQQRDELATKLLATFDNFRRETVPYVGYLSWETLNLDEMRGEVAQVVKDAQSGVDTLIQTSTQALDAAGGEAEKTLEAIRSASAQVGVGVHAKIFGDVAAKTETTAKWWLFGSALAAVATAVAAILVVTFWEAKGDISEASVLQVVLAKAVVLAVGFYTTFQSFRMYRSHVHLSVTNRHRETALKTFQSFAEGSDDKETRDKVLLEATHTIFGHTSTGLVDARDSANVLELLDGGVGSIMRRST